MTEERIEPGTTQLLTPGDYAAAIERLLRQANRYIDIMSPELTPVVFENKTLIDELQRFMLGSRHCVVRILLRNSSYLVRDNGRLLSLVRRLSSKIAVRKLSEHFYDRDDAFIIADREIFALRKQAKNWRGLYDESRPEKARQLTTVFNDMWEHSMPDPQLRRLHL